jgi:hypothetical protein|tara:strand:+ start:1994 stop:3247 length:1254 start_codon:yes stop_codon:yes gene_type:complete
MIKILNIQWDDELQKLDFITKEEKIFDKSYFITGFENLSKFIENEVIFCDKIPSDKYIVIINHENEEHIIDFLKKQDQIESLVKNEKIIDDLKKDKCKLIVTKIEGAVNDAGHTDASVPGHLRDFLDLHNIPWSNFIWMTPELLLNNYEENFPFKVKFFNRWALQIESHRLSGHKYPNLISLNMFKNSRHFSRLKYFYSVGTSSRPHRIDLLKFLHENDFLGKGHITFFNQVFDGDPWFEENNIPEEISKLLPLGRDLKLARENFRGISPTLAINSVRVMNCYYQIVTTSIWNQNELSDKFHVFFNEKIWKPILTFHPFIVLGQYKTLECLRNMGFKTFEPFIDESYDDIKNWESKKNKVYKEIKRLNSMSKKEIHDWYWGMEDILVYNFHRLQEYAVEENNKLINIIKKEWKELHG